MEPNLKRVAKWGPEWQAAENWRAHTIDALSSQELAAGYLGLVRSCCGWKPSPGNSTGLDIGAGAGFLASAFAQYGIRMTAAEFHQNGIELIQRENPQLDVMQLDVTNYDGESLWDFIFCRELYPFTRTNAFSDQREIVLRLVNSLKPRGVLLLVGSDVAWPDCMDYALLIKVLRKENGLRKVSAMYLEPLLRRCRRWGIGNAGYWVAYCLLWPYIAYKKRFRGWASICAIAIQKQ